MPMEINYVKQPDLTEAQVLSLYASVGWQTEVHEIQNLLAGLQKSYVLAAMAEDRLIGLLSGVTDEYTIFYLNDLLIHPEFQNHEVGSELLNQLIQQYQSIDQMVVIADNHRKMEKFYEKAGFCDMSQMNARTFIRDVRLG